MTDVQWTGAAWEIRFLRVWLKQINDDLENAVAELEKLKDCPKTVKWLVNRASFPLGFATRSLADIGDFLHDWSDTKEGSPEQVVCESLQKADPELVVAQVDASIEILRKAFSAARLQSPVTDV